LYSTFFYLLQDFAFVPVQVLLVTLFLSELLNRKSKIEMQQKLNMVIGVFFSETGMELIKILSEFDNCVDTMRSIFAVDTGWKSKDFDRVSKLVQKHDYCIDSRRGDLTKLQTFLLEKRTFLAGLLENPNLLEHETFTELLWSVFHITEELGFRSDCNCLPEDDYKHVSGDIRRAYMLLLLEWLAYLKHLSEAYPYMFSLVVRMNPMNPAATAVIGTNSEAVEPTTEIVEVTESA